MKYLKIIIGIVLLISFCGCDNNNPDQPITPPAKEETVSSLIDDKRFIDAYNLAVSQNYEDNELDNIIFKWQENVFETNEVVEDISTAKGIKLHDFQKAELYYKNILKKYVEISVSDFKVADELLRIGSALYDGSSFNYFYIIADKIKYAEYFLICNQREDELDFENTKYYSNTIKYSNDSPNVLLDFKRIINSYKNNSINEEFENLIWCYCIDTYCKDEIDYIFSVQWKNTNTLLNLSNKLSKDVSYENQIYIVKKYFNFAIENNLKTDNVFTMLSCFKKNDDTILTLKEWESILNYLHDNYFNELNNSSQMKNTYANFLRCYYYQCAINGWPDNLKKYLLLESDYNGTKMGLLDNYFDSHKNVDIATIKRLIQYVDTVNDYHLYLTLKTQIDNNEVVYYKDYGDTLLDYNNDPSLYDSALSLESYCTELIGGLTMLGQPRVDAYVYNNYLIAKNELSNNIVILYKGNKLVNGFCAYCDLGYVVDGSDVIEINLESFEHKKVYTISTEIKQIRFVYSYFVWLDENNIVHRVDLSNQESDSKEFVDWLDVAKWCNDVTMINRFEMLGKK